MKSYRSVYDEVLTSFRSDPYRAATVANFFPEVHQDYLANGLDKTLQIGAISHYGFMFGVRASFRENLKVDEDNRLLIAHVLRQHGLTIDDLLGDDNDSFSKFADNFLLDYCLWQMKKSTEPIFLVEPELIDDLIRCDFLPLPVSEFQTPYYVQFIQPVKMLVFSSKVGTGEIGWIGSFVFIDHFLKENARDFTMLNIFYDPNYPKHRPMMVTSTMLYDYAVTFDDADFIFPETIPLVGFSDEEKQSVLWTIHAALINTVTYITKVPDPSVMPVNPLEILSKSGKKTKKLKRELKKRFLRAAPYTIVGRGYKSPLGSAERTKLTAEDKIKVRGHFKWQPCGHERKKRKLIFVSAYWRGEGRVKNRRFKVVPEAQIGMN